MHFKNLLLVSQPSPPS